MNAKRVAEQTLKVQLDLAHSAIERAKGMGHFSTSISLSVEPTVRERLEKEGYFLVVASNDHATFSYTAIYWGELATKQRDKMLTRSEYNDTKFTIGLVGVMVLVGIVAVVVFRHLG